MIEHSPSAERNKGPVLEALREILEPAARVLEVGSGSGLHAVYITQQLTELVWQPTNQPGNLSVLTQYLAEQADPGGIMAPMALDVLEGDWPVGPFDALIAINVIHIAPWIATPALFDGASKVMGSGSKVILYGPYRYASRPFEPSNAEFDRQLSQNNPDSGIRLFEDVEASGKAAGFVLQDDLEMPSNNRLLVFTRL